MPIYEYKCSECGNVSEEIRNISDRNNEAICNNCGNNAHNIISSFNVNDNVCPDSREPNIDQKPKTSGLHVTNCSFENMNTGISLPKGAKISMKGNKFKNVKKPIELRNK